MATQNNKQKKRLYVLLLCFFLIVLVVTMGIILYQKIRQNQAENAITDLAEQVISEPEPVETPEELVPAVSSIPERIVDWEEIHNQNEDAYAWIYIPNTTIDTPVMSSGPTEDTDFYLNHAFDKSRNAAGCVYSQKSFNTTELTDFNQVLYGHVMVTVNGFKDLHDFEDLAFFKENRYIYLYTEEKNYAYEIFAAYQRDYMHILFYSDPYSETGRQDYINSIYSARDMISHYAEEIEVTPDDHILTLSTCVNGNDSLRYIVQGVLAETIDRDGNVEIIKERENETEE